MTTSRLAPSFLPPVGVLEMTYRCNHACRFCSCPWEDDRPEHLFRREPELSVAEWKAAISTLCDMGVSVLAFTGGEPLLKEGILDLLRFAATCTVEHMETLDGTLVSHMGPPRIHLLSNGRVLTPEVLDLCAALGIQLSLSLPGLESFAWHTNGGDAAWTLARLADAHARGITTTVAVTTTRRNLSELYETLAAGLLAGADTVLLNRFLPGGRGLRHANVLRLAPDEVIQMVEVADEVLRTANRKGSVGTELPHCLLGDRTTTNLEVGTRCAAAVGFFVVGPSGWIRACNHSPVNLVHLRDIDALRLHPYWMRFIRKDWLPAACRGCRWMGACDGGCREAAHIVGGALDAVDDCAVGVVGA